MKKRVFSILTALCLCLTLLPTAAFAEGNTEESSACTCETACTAESMNTDCPVCGSEDALPENCGKYAAPVNGEESVTGTSAQALTNAKITFPAPKEGKNISEAMKTASGDADSGLTLYLTGPALWTQGQRPDKLEEDATYAEGNIYLLNFTFYTQKPITEETALTCNGESVARYADYQALTEALNDYDGKQDAYLGCVLFSAEGTGDPSMGDLRDLYLLTIYAFVHVPKTLTTQDVSTAKELTAALADSSNEAVRLTKDITIDARLDIKRSVTVDLNGHVLRYDETAEPDSIFRVNSDPDSVCTLTLTDSRPQAEHEDETLPAGGLITGGKGFAHDNGAGQSYTYYGGGVYVETGASFVLAGGTIYACGVQSGANSAYGGGIYAEGGSVTMTGGAIRNCVLSANNGANGGGVYIYSGASFTMEGGVISGCSAMSGGGISASEGTVRITGGRIENCKASEHGGGLYIGGHADQISVLDAAISGCEAKNGGGVALMGFAELELGENARITGCTATNGAAVYMDLGSTHTVNHPGCFLYANGGRVEGTVYVGTNKIGTKNNYLDSVKATNAIDHTDGKPTTVFTDNVSCEGDIRGGIFHGSVTVTDSNGDMGTAWEKFCGNLSGGTFYGPVTTECHVSGGTYYGGLTLEKNAKLSGKPMNTGSEITDKTNIPNPNGTPVTVTYAYGALGGTYATQIVQTGEKAIEPDVPSRQGYRFTGWYLDDTKYDFNAAVTKDMTLTARWKDIEKPTGEIIIGTDKWQEFLNELTSGLFFKNTQEVTINAADNSGIVFASYLVTDQDLSEEELKSLVYRAYDEPFRIEPNGEYIVYVMLVDASLNITYLRSDRLTLDNVQPVISGVENGKTYCGARTVTITEKYIDTVTVNGTTVELDESDSFRLAPANGRQKIIVADKAGNTTEMTVTVNDGHTYGEWTSNGDGTHTRKCTVDGCAGSESKDCSGGKATCRDKAKCAVCGKTYGELDAKNHADLKHIPAKAATWVAEGNIEYWYCEGCGRYFSDRDGTKEIRKTDIVTAKRKSGSAAAKPEDELKSPGTGDTGSLALWIALLLASGGAAIGTTVVSRKKYNR